jgi:hypothetical protein
MIYQQMGDIGAISAYLDRNGMSKGWLFFALITGMSMYYPCNKGKK